MLICHFLGSGAEVDNLQADQLHPRRILRCPQEPVTHLDDREYRVLVFPRDQISYRDVAPMQITVADEGGDNIGLYRLQVHRDVLAQGPASVTRRIRHPDCGPRD